jgi:hypothetical protein
VSQQKVWAGSGDEGGGDLGAVLLGGDLEGLEAEVVAGPEVAAGDLVEGVGGVVGEELGRGAGELAGSSPRRARRTFR